MLSLLFSMIFLTLISFNINFFVMIYYFFFIFIFFLLNFEVYNFFSFISFGLGLDTYSYCLIILTLWLFLMTLYASLNLMSLYFFYLKFIMVLMLMFLFLCFTSLSFFSFYFYFECSVIPIFLMIYGWGYQPERVYSSLYFFFYTLFSSLPLLVLILSLSNSLGYFYYGAVFFSVNFYLFLFMIFSFLVSLPMFFFHLWLPKAHVEAPSAGSMILAGVMLKLGGYGLLRVCYIFINLINSYSYIFISLSLLGSLYVSIFCLLQSDLKVLVAYSSVSHMSLVICGVMTLTHYGVLGSLYLMISHGLVSSGLFYFVGCLFNRLSSRSLFLMSGFLSYSPSFSLFFFLLIVSNMSCPPSLNLISEVFISFSLFNWQIYSMIFVFFSLFFCACAMVCLFSFICHGLLTGVLLKLDSGMIKEFYLMTLHIFPVYMFIMNLNFLA